MATAGTSETLVNFFQTTRRYNPEDSHLQASFYLYYPTHFFQATWQRNAEIFNICSVVDWVLCYLGSGWCCHLEAISSTMSECIAFYLHLGIAEKFDSICFSLTTADNTMEWFHWLLNVINLVIDCKEEILSIRISLILFVEMWFIIAKGRTS
jgi:hypothetical protein